MIEKQQDKAKITSWLGWLVAAALFLFACGNLASSGATPAVVEVTRIVERIVTVPVVAQADNADDSPSPESSPDAENGSQAPELAVVTATPGFNPTRPALPSPPPRPPQPPLLPRPAAFSAAQIQLFREVSQWRGENCSGYLPTSTS